MKCSRSVAAAGAAAIGAIGLVGLGGAPADAAWTSVNETAGAQSYACKVVHGKKATVRFWVDARQVATWIKSEVVVTTADGTEDLRSATVTAPADSVSEIGHIVVSKKASRRGRLATIIASPGSGSAEPLTLKGMKKC